MGRGASERAGPPGERANEKGPGKRAPPLNQVDNLNQRFWMSFPAVTLLRNRLENGSNWVTKRLQRVEVGGAKVNALREQV